MIPRKIALSIFILILLLTFTVTATAHPGSTDEDGGHVDRSTGEYHYHHGYPAHEHYDMNHDGRVDCPYDFDDQTDRRSRNASSSKNNTAIAIQTSDDSSDISEQNTKSTHDSSDNNGSSLTGIWIAIYIFILIIPILLVILGSIRCSRTQKIGLFGSGLVLSVFSYSSFISEKLQDFICYMLGFLGIDAKIKNPDSLFPFALIIIIFLCIKTLKFICDYKYRPYIRYLKDYLRGNENKNLPSCFSFLAEEIRQRINNSEDNNLILKQPTLPLLYSIILKFLQAADYYHSDEYLIIMPYQESYIPSEQECKQLTHLKKKILADLYLNGYISSDEYHVAISKDNTSN